MAATFYALLSATGQTLIPPLAVSAGNGMRPSIALGNGGMVYVAFTDRFGRTPALVGLLPDNAPLDGSATTLATIQAFAELDPSSGFTDQVYPVLATDAAGNVHMAWNDADDFSEINYVKYDATGALLAGPTAIGSVPGNSSAKSKPNILVDAGGNAHIVWMDDKVGIGVVDELYYDQWRDRRHPDRCDADHDG
ncbi:MAG: hypothetical protein R8K46_08985 [Mariprofundaceae bacterium]